MIPTSHIGPRHRAEVDVVFVQGLKLIDIDKPLSCDSMRSSERRTVVRFYMTYSFLRNFLGQGILRESAG